MKLLFCLSCNDIRKLDYDKVFCKCNKSWGFYHEDGLTATYSNNNSYIIGMSNQSISKAITIHKATPNSDLARIDSWIMRDDAPNIRKGE